MAMTVKEALKEISAERDENGKLKVKQFSRKDFDNFMLACVNDTDFSTERIKVEKNTITHTEPEQVSLMFREWLRKVVESMGVDKHESEKILSSDFEIKNVKGLYEFFTSVIYDYMEAGNYFAFPDRTDFRGKLYLKENDGSIITKMVKNPKTKEETGPYEITKNAHKTLAAKSTCPGWMKSRKGLF